jgi:hypothetical protein
VSSNCVARPDCPRQSRLPRPSVDGTTRAANRDDGSPGVVVCLAWVLRTRAAAVSSCHLHPRFVRGLPRRLRDRNGINTDSATAALGFPLGIASGQIPMLGDLWHRSSIALIHDSRRDLASRQTICIAGPLKSPPEAHAVTPSRSPRCHHASETASNGFQLGITTVWVWLLWKGSSNSFTALIPRSRRAGSGFLPRLLWNIFEIVTRSAWAH